MKDNSLQMCMLFDFYGPLLSDRQKEVFDLYYNEDLSLSEIAENTGISRQGVRDAVVKAGDQLLEAESKLGLAEKFLNSQKAFEKISDDVEFLLELNKKRFRSSDIDIRLTDILSLVSQNS